MRASPVPSSSLLALLPLALPLLAGCPILKEDLPNPVACGCRETADTADTADTGDTADTSDTADTGDTADTATASAAG